VLAVARWGSQHPCWDQGKLVVCVTDGDKYDIEMIVSRDGRLSEAEPV
jgi:hypothetical protein